MKSKSLLSQIRAKSKKSRLVMITKVQISAAAPRFSASGACEMWECRQATRHNCVIGHFDFEKAAATRKVHSDFNHGKESQHECCTEQSVENIAQLIADEEQVPVTCYTAIISASLNPTIALRQINNVGKTMIQFRGRSGRVCRGKNGGGTVLADTSNRKLQPVVGLFLSSFNAATNLSH